MRFLLAAALLAGATATAPATAHAAPICPVADRDPCTSITRAVDCAVKLQPPCIYL